MSHLYFNEENYYFGENKCDNKVFQPTFFILSLKETKHIHASAADLLDTPLRNLNWCKCRHFKNKAREIDCLCCREVNAKLDASAKIPEREGSILSSSLYDQLPDY